MKESRITTRKHQLDLPIFTIRNGRMAPVTLKPKRERLKHWLTGLAAVAIWSTIFVDLFANITQG